MRALTIWPEFIWAICYLGKRVENRTWTPPDKMIGKRIALHAGAHVGGSPGRTATESGLTGLVGMAVHEGWAWMMGEHPDFVSFYKPGSLPIEMCLDPDLTEAISAVKPVVKKAIVGTAVLDKVEKYERERVPWGVAGMYHWFLRDLVFFEEPIPANGKQRLWRLSEEQEKQVERAS